MELSGVPVGLLERAGELSRLADLVRCAQAGSGSFALVEGPAGIGKTSLLDVCVERARELGVTALRATGDEVAMESPFVVARELLWPAVSDPETDVLAGAARFAAPVFEGLPSESDDRDRVGTVLHGLYWLVANLSERGPLLLVVDDAHWLDPASGRFLVHLAKRIDSLPVVVLVAARLGEVSETIGALTALSAAADPIVRPAPLSDDAAAVMVRRELGKRVDDELCRVCVEATGGNPFYLRALIAALRSEGGRPTVELATRVRGLGAGALGRSLLVRLARLGEDCQRLASAVAVLAPGSPLRHAAELAGLDRDRAEAAADQLRAIELLAPGRELSFVHPIVYEAIAADLAPSGTAAMHLRAAALLLAEAAPLDRVATHLLAAEAYGETWVVEVLRGAARAAVARGAPEAAVSYLSRALAEPPASELRLEVLLELGRAEAQLPYAHNFRGFREALECTNDVRQRAEIALELGWGLTATGRNGETAAVLNGILERSDELDPVLVERIETLLIGAGAGDLTMGQWVRDCATRHLGRLERGDSFDPVLLGPAVGLTGALMGLPMARVKELVRPVLAQGPLLEFAPAFLGASMTLLVYDQLLEAGEALDAALAEAQRRGSVPMFVQMSTFRAGVSLRLGHLDVAEDHAERAFELGAELGNGHWGMLYLLPILLERGRPAEAMRLLSTLPLGDAELCLWPGVIALSHRGRASVASGDPQSGLADLLDADRRMAAAGCDLSVITDWVPAAVTALVALGRDHEAQAVAERELTAATVFGAPRRLGIALSTCGLLDRDSRGPERLREAVALLDSTPALLDQARALVNLGIGLRVRGETEEARTALAQAMDTAHRCGGWAVAETAREQLIGLGARPRRDALTGPGALTPAELRTARMAADGLTNREIAQALFVSTKTVETHLSHAYAKLGIERRTGLSAALRP